MSYYRVRFEYLIVVEADDEDEAVKDAVAEVRGMAFQDVGLDFMYTSTMKLADDETLKEVGE